MTRIHEGTAPMFTTSANMHDPTHTTRFLDETAPKSERETGISVSAGWSTIDEGVKLVMIDTDLGAGRIRIDLNDGTIWDGDPESDVKRTPEQIADSIEGEHPASFWSPREVRVAIARAVREARA